MDNSLINLVKRHPFLGMGIYRITDNPISPPYILTSHPPPPCNAIATRHRRKGKEGPNPLWSTIYFYFSWSFAILIVFFFSVFIFSFFLLSSTSPRLLSCFFISPLLSLTTFSFSQRSHFFSDFHGVSFFHFLPQLLFPISFS